MRFRKDVTDDELAVARLPQIAELMRHVVPASTCPVDEEPKQRSGREAEQKRTVLERSHGPHATNPSSLAEELRLYLESVAGFPNDTTTQRAQRLALSPDKSNRLKKAALSKGLAEEIALNLGQATGGLVKLLDLTPAGCKAIGNKPHPRPDNVSAEHWWWQRNIHAYYRSLGFESRIEWALNGKRADVGFVKDGRKIAVEVELTPKNASSNVLQDLRCGYADVLVCCTNTRARRAIEAQLEEVLDERQKARVRVVLLSELSFVKRLFGKGRSKTALQDS